MAGDWIKVETITPDKPEIHQIAEVLNIEDPDTVRIGDVVPEVAERLLKINRVARELKKGLDHFPLDCNIDNKFRAVIRKFGAKGYGVLIGLLQLIYSNGYYLEVSGGVIEDHALEMGVDVEKVEEIISFCIKRNIFNEEMWENNILTSSEIQKRYKEVIAEG